MEYTLIQILAHFGVGLLGVVAHFLKKKVKGESFHAVKNWFMGHFKETALSFLLYIGSFILLVEMGELSFYAVFLSGYTCDSVFSRKE